MKIFFCLLAAFLLAPSASAQTSAAPDPDSASFDPDGTAHITRVVPMPATVSPEAQKWLKEIEKQSPQSQDLAEIRKGTDAWRKWDSAEALRLYPVKVEGKNIAGVRTDIITPLDEAKGNRVLINLHGGGIHLRFRIFNRRNSHRISHQNKSCIRVLSSRAGEPLPSRG